MNDRGEGIDHEKRKPDNTNFVEQKKQSRCVHRLSGYPFECTLSGIWDL